MRLNRRQFLIGTTAAASFSALATGCQARWSNKAYRKTVQSRVAILPAANYEIPLTDTIKQGIRLAGLEPQGKRVVLKPNLVEFDPTGVINTNPAVVAATIDAFRSLGAREVVVAEGPGHRRDTEYLLTASGLYAALEDQHTPFTDLNLDDVQRHPLLSHYTPLEHIYFPATITDADLLVSMPKMKTHHWVGVTLSLKNMFGIMPGSVYGWPKNVLHWSGIEKSIIDINSSLPVPQFAIVDGIVGMEGDGPVDGQAKSAGVLIFGQDMVAVDATASRLMGIDPGKVGYLAEAGKFLGNVESENIQQVGEAVDYLQQDFRLLASFQHLKRHEV
jgi:uncharacterized protein (DUF362 family)